MGITQPSIILQGNVWGRASKHVGIDSGAVTVWVMGYIAFMIPILAGLTTFVSWPQVELLHRSGLDLDLLYGHPHFFRYLVARPGFLLADRFGDVAFSFYLGNFAFGSLMLMYSLVRRQSFWIAASAVLLVLVIQMLMNGRGVISWFGWMIILKIVLDSPRVRPVLHFCLLIFALLCTSVSSGTFSVAFGTTLAFLAIRIDRANWWRLIGIMAALLASYWGLFMQGVERNLAFYSLGNRNPVINMLQHGAGDIVINHPVAIVLAICSALLALLLLWNPLLSKMNARDLIVLIVPVGGGLFGYTTLSLLVPSVVAVLARRAGNRSASGIETPATNRV